MQFEQDQITIQRDHGQIILYRRPDHKSPKWQVRIKIDGATGYIRKSTRTMDQHKAREFASQLYTSLADKQKATGSIQTKTFKQVANEWLRLAKEEYSEATYKDFEGRLLNYPVVFWGDKYIDSLDDSDLQAFIAWRKKNGAKGKCSANTIKRDIVPLRHVLRHAFSQKYTPRHLKFDPIKTKKSRRPHFTEDEWQEIINKLPKWVGSVEKHAHQYRKRLYMQYYVLVLGETGIRPGTEASSLTWSSMHYVQFANQERKSLVIEVTAGKKGRREMVPNKMVETYLFELKSFREEELRRDGLELNEKESIFCHKNGAPINSVKKGFKKFLQEYGLLLSNDSQERVPYSLRHTYATRHIRRADCDHWDLARNMGTSVEQLERYYVHDEPTKFGKSFINSPSLKQTSTLSFLE